MTHRPSFGIKTSQAHIGYQDILRIWQEADTIPLIEHAWLWDHFIPLFGDPGGSALEGWTLLAALAARTERLHLGLMVTNNRARLPAVLAKMASTVDVISAGRLVMGLGVGGTRQNVPGQELAVREYDAYGIPLVPPSRGIGELAETCQLLRRMWTEELFDFDGRYLHLTGVRCAPKPVQRPGPPILIGGWGERTLRVVAEHADIWNAPGPPFNDIAAMADRGRLLDTYCAEIGRDPAEITRSTQTHAYGDNPAGTRDTLRELIDAGFTHLVLSPLLPRPEGAARWLADEIIAPVLDQVRAG
jgi:alkanesulfonate monooxygenase SsuD/methylene tetrahydromethanopterin reductase-like flavin-dependent oxidoreductase (luciferase family)